jgi:hypothetical protein
MFERLLSRDRVGPPWRFREGLHMCPVCQAAFVHPMEWQALADDRWAMLLRCAECELWLETIVPNDVAVAYDRWLQWSTERIADELRRLDHDRMIADVAALVAALERDLVDASDFAR